MPVLLAIIFISIFLVPVLSLVFFISTLYDLLTLRRENRETPGSIRPEELKRCRIHFILASAVFACVVLILWGIGWVLSGGIPFM